MVPPCPSRTLLHAPSQNAGKVSFCPELSWVVGQASFSNDGPQGLGGNQPGEKGPKCPGVLGRDEEPPGLGLWAGEAPSDPGSCQSWKNLNRSLNLSSADALAPPRKEVGLTRSKPTVWSWRQQGGSGRDRSGSGGSRGMRSEDGPPLPSGPGLPTLFSTRTHMHTL